MSARALMQAKSSAQASRIAIQAFHICHKRRDRSYQSIFLPHCLPGPSCAFLIGLASIGPSSVALILLAETSLFQYMIICAAMTALSTAAPAKPQKMSGSLTSCFVVKSRARHPRRALKTAKAERFPVDWFLWLDMIWGNLELSERGSVTA